MVKHFIYFILCIFISCQPVIAKADFLPPKIPETSDVLGHIFRKEPGHFESDTPFNRAYIEAAAADSSNKLATNRWGVEIRMKTMPDGTILAVTGGPVEADGHTWWQVRDSEGSVGWCAEEWLELSLP